MSTLTQASLSHRKLPSRTSRPVEIPARGWPGGRIRKRDRRSSARRSAPGCGTVAPAAPSDRTCQGRCRLACCHTHPNSVSSCRYPRRSRPLFITVAVGDVGFVGLRIHPDLGHPPEIIEVVAAGILAHAAYLHQELAVLG